MVTVAPVTRAELFGISLDIDAHAASMSQSGERAVDGVTAGRIALGQTVTWQARHFGIWFTMTSKITDLEEPIRFVDQQVSGPFRVLVPYLRHLIAKRNRHLIAALAGTSR